MLIFIFLCYRWIKKISFGSYKWSLPWLLNGKSSFISIFKNVDKNVEKNLVTLLRKCGSMLHINVAQWTCKRYFIFAGVQPILLRILGTYRESLENVYSAEGTKCVCFHPIFVSTKEFSLRKMKEIYIQSCLFERTSAKNAAKCAVLWGLRSAGLFGISRD